MFKKMLIMAITILLFSPHLCSVFAKNSNSLEVITYTISLKGQALNVRIDCPAGSNEPSVFGISDWAGIENFSDNIYHVEASSASNDRLKIAKPYSNRWVVNNDGKAFSLQYVLRSSKSNFIGIDEEDSFQPTFLKNLTFLWGYSVFLTPANDYLRSFPVRLIIDNETETKLFSSLPEEKTFKSISHLTNSMFVAGDLRCHTAQVLGVPVEFYLSGMKWQFSDAEFISVMKRIISNQARAMGSYPVDKMMIVLLEGSEESSGGTVVKDAIALYPSPDKGPIAGNESLLTLVAHENFHLWNGSSELFPESSHKEGYYKWFQEGFTEYFTAVTLLKEGLITRRRFSEKINKLLRNYYTNPLSKTASIEDIAQNYWSSDNYKNLPYNKGAIIAFIFDHAIQHFSNRKMSITNYFRSLLKIMKQYPNGYDIKVLRQTFLELTDESAGEIFDECVFGVKELPLKKAGQMFSFPVEEKIEAMFDLGFEYDEPKLKSGVKVKRVSAFSAAEKAGLKAGDVLTGVDIYYGDPSKKVRFNIDRDGEKIDIGYYPKKEMAILQLKLD
ncbi:MAG: hypothetical protein KKB51_10485 [Candidatus Riflebacteria bacterium]|nr:hypothetical protein [Candidatus Riflebacteria bacterium]